jgi:hypothetical protein
MPTEHGLTRTESCDVKSVDDNMYPSPVQSRPMRDVDVTTGGGKEG